MKFVKANPQTETLTIEITEDELHLIERMLDPEKVGSYKEYIPITEAVDKVVKFIKVLDYFSTKSLASDNTEIKELVNQLNTSCS